MKVEVLSDINSGQHKKGDVVEFSDEEAKDLIAAGAVQSLEKEQPEQPQTPVDDVDHTEVTPPAADPSTPPVDPELAPPQQPTPEQIQGDMTALNEPQAPVAPQFPPQDGTLPQQPQDIKVS